MSWHDDKYAQGFDAGERAACRDRRLGKTRLRPMMLRDTYERAWWDGYTPRSSTWARSAEVKGAWWAEREPAVVIGATA